MGIEMRWKREKRRGRKRGGGEVMGAGGREKRGRENGVRRGEAR